MFSGRLLCAGYTDIALLVLVLFSVNCHAQRRHSSCGDIQNISFPFRFKSDPEDNCGVKDFELACENNRTILYLYSGKYYVQAIDYNNYTLRIVDVGIQTNNRSSLPLHSLTPLNFTYSSGPYSPRLNLFAVFVSCENPVVSPLYIEYSNSGRPGISGWRVSRHSYVLVGDYLGLSDLVDSCTVDMMVMIPSQFLRRSYWNVSFLEVHNELAYGFDLSWTNCGEELRQQSFCFSDAQNLSVNCLQTPQYHWTWLPDFLGNLKSFLLSGFWIDIRRHIYLELVIIGAILAARTLCVPCVFGFLIYTFRRRHLSTFDNIEGFLRSQNNLMPIRYSYSDIKKMTKGFRNKLGEGGYGSVYKGKLRSGHLVAVKMLSKPKADGQEFINEVATIGRIHHINVVRLIGYCAERSKRALVYDFMPNGSLEKYIFSQEENFSLSFEQIFHISIGVARGIKYLHRGCDVQILHFDIKPHNILLDENFTPKVSDFGLAKLFPTDDSIVPLTAARGTLGYMAPELFYKNIGGVSYKADIYSYGMLLMEMAGRRRNWNSLANSSQIYFPSWVYDQFEDGRRIEMGEITEGEREMVKKMMVVALWCIQMKPSDRPSMNKVVEMLEGNIENLQMAPRPFLYPQATNHTNLPALSGACLDSVTLDVSPR